MGLFSSKKKSDDVQEDTPVSKDTASDKVSEVPPSPLRTAPPSPSSKDGTHFVLRNPRITEKAAMASDELNTYVFDVDSRATKNEIARAFRARYNIAPTAVRTSRIPRKPVARGGILGMKGGGKKAYITLPKGKSIEIV